MEAPLSRTTPALTAVATQGAVAALIHASIKSDPRPVLSDDALRGLCAHTPDRDRGILSTREQAALAAYLPDICGELLARRATARKEQESTEAILCLARRIMRAARPDHRALNAACATVLCCSANAAERAVAEATLREIGTVA